MSLKIPSVLLLLKLMTKTFGLESDMFPSVKYESDLALYLSRLIEITYVKGIESSGVPFSSHKIFASTKVIT